MCVCIYIYIYMCVCVCVCVFIYYICVCVCVYVCIAYLLLIQRNNEDRFETRFYEPETKQLHGMAATTVRAFERRTAGWKAVNIWKSMRPAKVFRGFTQS